MARGEKGSQSAQLLYQHLDPRIWACAPNPLAVPLVSGGLFHEAIAIAPGKSDGLDGLVCEVIALGNEPGGIVRSVASSPVTLFQITDEAKFV